MTLLDKIKQQLKQNSHEEILTAMGYFNIKRGRQTLLRFTTTDSIYLWLKNGTFDMKYTSKEFLLKLCKVLDIPSYSYEEEIRQSLHRINAIRVMRKPYVFIDTQFKRASQPLFVLAIMENERRIQIDKELLVYKSNTEIFSIISELVQDHYVKSGGALRMWGTIDVYVYHHVDGTQQVFNPDGTHYHHLCITETKAELAVGNKTIF